MGISEIPGEGCTYFTSWHSLKSLGALMYLKPKTLINVHLSSWLPKFKCLGDVLDSVSLS